MTGPEVDDAANRAINILIASFGWPVQRLPEGAATNAVAAALQEMGIVATAREKSMIASKVTNKMIEPTPED